MVLVVKMGIKLDDIGVVEGVVDLKLAGELLDHVVFYNSGLKDLFDGIEGACGFVDGFVNVTKFP
jgi:hypothetical protein